MVVAVAQLLSLRTLTAKKLNDIFGPNFGNQVCNKFVTYRFDVFELIA